MGRGCLINPLNGGPGLPEECNEWDIARLFGNGEGGYTDPTNPEDMIRGGPPLWQTWFPHLHGAIDPPKPHITERGGIDPYETCAPGPDEDSDEAGTPSQTASDGGAKGAPTSPGSRMTPEQVQNQSKRDEHQMHAGPSIEDLRSIREGLERDNTRQSVYVPYTSDHRDPAALARRDNARLLRGIVGQRARQRNASNRGDREPPMQRGSEPSVRADRSPMLRTLRAPMGDPEYQDR